MEDDRLFAAWLLLVTTGMRRGEVLALRWADVDLDARRLAIRRTTVIVGYEPEQSDPKTKAGRRVVALDERTVSALRNHRDDQERERKAAGPLWHRTGLVFAREDGSAIHPQRFSKWFTRHARRAGLPPIRLHDVRHSYATAALSAGVPAKVVSSRLGHASVGITLDTYSHVLPSFDEQAATTVADHIFGPPQEGSRGDP